MSKKPYMVIETFKGGDPNETPKLLENLAGFALNIRRRRSFEIGSRIECLRLIVATN